MVRSSSVVCQPSWNHLETVYASPKTIFVASPWISSDGCEFLRRMRGEHPDAPWEIWTRFDAFSFVAGLTDYTALLALSKEIGTSKLILCGADKLHLKVFWDGKGRALVGSCNLTSGGFETNIEAAAYFSDCPHSLTDMLTGYRKILPEMSIRDFETFVDGLSELNPVRQEWTELRSRIEAVSRARGIRKQREPPYLGLR